MHPSRKNLYTSLLVVGLTGCIRPVDTLASIQETASAARQAAQAVVDTICGSFAQQCTGDTRPAALDDEACKAFFACDGYRQALIMTFEHINLLIADANLSLRIGDAKSADAAIAQIMQLLVEVQKQMRDLGYLK